jgi:hypothetical protein
MLSSRRAARWVLARSSFSERACAWVAALGTAVALTGVLFSLPSYVWLCAAFSVWAVLLRPLVLELRAQWVVSLTERRWESSDPAVASWVAVVMVAVVSSRRLDAPAPARLWALSGFSERSPLLGPWLHDLLTSMLADVHIGFPYVKSVWYRDALLSSTEELAMCRCVSEALELAALLPVGRSDVSSPRPGGRADDLKLAVGVARAFDGDTQLARLCLALAPSWVGTPEELVAAGRALLAPADGVIDGSAVLPPVLLSQFVAPFGVASTV